MGGKWCKFRTIFFAMFKPPKSHDSGGHQYSEFSSTCYPQNSHKIWNMPLRREREENVYTNHQIISFHGFLFIIWISFWSTCTLTIDLIDQKAWNVTKPQGVSDTDKADFIIESRVRAFVVDLFWQFLFLFSSRCFVASLVVESQRNYFFLARENKAIGLFWLYILEGLKHMFLKVLSIWWHLGTNVFVLESYLTYLFRYDFSDASFQIWTWSWLLPKSRFACDASQSKCCHTLSTKQSCVWILSCLFSAYNMFKTRWFPRFSLVIWSTWNLGAIQESSSGIRWR